MPPPVNHIAILLSFRGSRAIAGCCDVAALQGVAKAEARSRGSSSRIGSAEVVVTLFGIKLGNVRWVPFPEGRSFSFTVSRRVILAKTMEVG